MYTEKTVRHFQEQNFFFLFDTVIIIVVYSMI